MLRDFVDKELQHTSPDTSTKKKSEPLQKKGRFGDFADSSDEEPDNSEHHELDRYLTQRINIGQYQYSQ